MPGGASNLFGSEPSERPLELFFKGESKFYILPVPTPLSKKAATLFLATNIPQAESAARMRKLVRLAAFYNVSQAGDLFVKSFGGLGRPDAVGRWAAAIAGAAWVGTPEARARVRESLPDLLARADVFEDRDVIYDMFDAIGPEPADSKSAATGLARWLDAGIARYDMKIEEARKETGDEAAQMVQAQKGMVAEYRSANVPRLERVGAQRTKVLALPTDEAKIKAMVPLAIDQTPEGTRELCYWSSIMLLRLGGTTDPVPANLPGTTPVTQTDESKARPANREHIAAEFHKDAAARRAKIQDERKQIAQDLYRARSLRAAYYFGHPGEPADRVWLGLQADSGTDVLALRPDWEYPRTGGHE